MDLDIVSLHKHFCPLSLINASRDRRIILTARCSGIFSEEGAATTTTSAATDPIAGGWYATLSWGDAFAQGKGGNGLQLLFCLLL